MKASPKDIDQILVFDEYKFLGWQNGWGSPPSEYEKCISLGHRRDDIQHNSRGSENTVSCDICRIYYKYDCSD